MREILFRGKTYKGEWIEGNFIDWGNHVQVYIFPLLNYATFYDLGTSIRMQAQAVIPETVGQFTGLTDKNGKKIFKGDIIQGTITSAWNKELIRCEVVYERGCFISVKYSKYGRIWKHKLCFGKDIEVIGNIHDNPELLEVEE